ncbi:DUF7694 domain-containing protein [Bradyrhizobium sp. USDA 10063]
MRTIIPAKLEDGRIRQGYYASTAQDGPRGAFMIMGPTGEYLTILSSGTDREFGWEHVSVSTRRRTPNWAEMVFTKNLFWDESECVVEYHPPRSDYVNHAPNCLHLWKPVTGDIPMPPSFLVGPLS